MLELRAEIQREDRSMRYEFHADSTVTGVFGRSGAGKTTLLHLIAGLEKPTNGAIRLDGEVLFDSKLRIDRPSHRRRIGVVFQDERLFPHLNVRGNLRYGGRRRAGGEGVAERDVIELLELGPLLDRRVRGLSGGETRRVSLGRALLSSPRLLLLDEPLSFLDHDHQRRILGLIRRIRDQLAIPMLYVSHDLGELLQVTDRLLVIDRGRTVAHGPLREVARDAAAWTALRGLGPVNLLTLVVSGHDAEAGLTSLRPVATANEAPASDAILVAPLASYPPGSTVSVAVRPEDVALSIEPVTGISIQNQIAGRVVAVTTHPDRAVVEIATVLSVSLLVEVSHRTVGQMAIAPGRDVRCLIKSNAVEYVGSHLNRKHP